MARRYTGGFLSAKEQATDSNTANGVFTLAEHQEKMALGNFPTGRWTPQRSLRFRSSASAYLSRTPSAASNQKTWTWSSWIKLGSLGNGALFGANGTSYYQQWITVAGYSGLANSLTLSLFHDGLAAGNQYEMYTPGVLRDPSAWYHVMVSVDTTQAVASNRVKMYINGVQQTLSTTGGGWVPQNYNTYFNSVIEHDIGARVPASSGVLFDGYMSEVNFIDGQQLDPSYFGYTDPETGTWVPKRYTGTYGTNGFYLPFSDNSSTSSTALGKDNSPYYVMPSVAFNGTSNGLQRNGALTGATNGKQGTYSAWWNFSRTPQAAQEALWITRDNSGIGDGVTISRNNVGDIYFALHDASGNSLLQATTTNTPIAAANTWYHIYITWDTAAQQYAIYVNGVQATYFTPTWGSNTANIAYNLPNSGAGGWLYSPLSPTTAGSMGQLYVNYSAYLPAATYLSKFVSGTGTNATPVGLGSTGSLPTGSSPIVFLDGDASGILTNRGTGGNFSAYGTLSTGLTLSGTGGQNDWTPNNFSLTAGVTYDSMVDVPGIAAVSNQADVGGVQRGNYCTLNPLNRSSQISGNISQANLYVVNGSGWPGVSGTISVNSGKWYYECTVTGHTTNTSGIVGWCLASMPQDSDISNYIPQQGGFYIRNDTAGAKQKALNFSSTVDLISGAYGNGLVQIAVDFDNGKMWIGKDGSWITGNPSTGDTPAFSFSVNTSAGYTPFIGPARNDIAQQTYTCNFGQRPFTYTPPAGFKSLCTTNLPNPIIKRPVEHFDIKTYTGNGTTLTIGNTAKQSTAKPISRSLRIKNSIAGGLTKAFAADGNRQKMTISAWVKRGAVGISGEQMILSGASNAANTPRDFFGFAGSSTGTATDTLTFGTNVSGTAWSFVYTNNVFRDMSSWYHVVLAIDTTQTSASNRVIIYVNGVRQSVNSSSTYPAQNTNLILNSATPHNVGKWVPSGNCLDGEVADYYFIDGQQLTPSSFGAFDANNNWIPQSYSGTYGTNGFYLPFNNPITTGNQSYAVHFSAAAGQYLTTPSSANLAMGTGDFTVEAFVNWQSYGNVSNPQIIGSSVDNFNLYVGTDFIGFYNGTASVYAYVSIPIGIWNHVAVTRQSGTMYFYLNGKLVGSAAQTANWSSAQTITIGRNNNTTGTSYADGYISNLRIVKGTALYTGNSYTVPTSTLTAVSGTQLLFATTSSLTDASSNNFTLTNNNNVPNPVLATPFDVNVAPTYSLYFGGNTELKNSTSTFTFGTNSFTVEFYMNATSTAGTYVGLVGLTSPTGALRFETALQGGTIQVYTDTGAWRDTGFAPYAGQWYHIAWVRNASNNTLKMYVNGVEKYSVSNTRNYSEAFSTKINIGLNGAYYNGYISSVRVNSTTALYTSTFTPPLSPLPAVAGTQVLIAQYNNPAADGSSNNLLFSPTPQTPSSTGQAVGYTTHNLPPCATGVGADAGSNANHFGTMNINNYSYGVSPMSVYGYDSLRDSPADVDVGTDYTGVSGNYVTLDPNRTVVSGGAAPVPFNGNLDLNFTAIGQWQRFVGSQAIPKSGKWYWEISYPVVVSPNNSINYNVGIASDQNLYPITDGAQSDGWIVFWNDSGTTKVVANQSRGSGVSYGSAIVAGDTLMIAVDCDNNKIYWGTNGTWFNSGNPVAGTNAGAVGQMRSNVNYLPSISSYAYTGQTPAQVRFNFGQKPFVYAPPTGFKSLNSKNFKDVGSNNLPDTFGNFVNTPDMVWIKNRNTTLSHNIYDTVRGPRQRIQPNLTNAQSSIDGVVGFLPNGVQLGNGTDDVNFTAGNTYAAWMWNRGKVPGFDIVNYGGMGAGTTFNHNLGTEPAFVIIKRTDSTSNWIGYHKDIGRDKYFYLSTTFAQSQTNAWIPTSTSFTITQNWTDAAASGETFIAYLWAEVPGFSKFGTYVGNGSTDGPFIYTGFRPKWIMIKRTDTTTDPSWAIYDTVRGSFNGYVPGLFASASSGESATTVMDINSNGFKIRNSDGTVNGSGGTWIYAAFAETPFKYANAR